ncbi:MAG: phage holin family protein [Casimicrobiaceae bacterium]
MTSLARRLVDDVTTTCLGHLELLGIEVRDAVNAVAQISVVAGLAILLLASAWFLLLAAGIVGLIAVGMHPAVVLVVAGLVSLGAGLACAMSIRPKLKSLQFPATLRQIRRAIDAHSPS